MFEGWLYIPVSTEYLICNNYSDFNSVTTYTLNTEAVVVTTYTGTTECLVVTTYTGTTDGWVMTT